MNILNDDFSFNEGEFILIVGKSGSGKTTFLKKIESSLKQKKVNVGLVMQNVDAQIVTDKVWHELCFGLENLGVDEKIMHRKASEMCSYFAMNDWLEKDTATLSGGQKQILNLASVMILNPSVLLLDEPTSQLDPVASFNFFNTVKKLNRELGITVIMSEHRIEDVFSDADKVYYIEDFNCSILMSDKKIIYNDENKDFLPMPARIFYGLKKSGDDVPLTIAQGRRFFEKWVRDSSGVSREAMERIAQPRIARPEASASERKGTSKKQILVEAKSVNFSYLKKGKKVLEEFDIEIFKGEIFSVMGANASGKSTLLKVLCGVEKCQNGKIKKNGDLKIMMMSQNARNVFCKKSVREELEECGWKVGAALKVFPKNIELTRHPYDLSGGECQKLALEKILLKNPDVILLDEPTRGLDNNFKKEFAKLLRKIASEGKSIVIVCHDIEFCAYASDRVSMMFEGRLCGTSDVHEFFEKNNFYTTSLNRMTRKIVDGIVIEEDLNV